MKADLTDITVVLDRSGSMATCRNDAEGGLNELIKKQKREAGQATFTLVQFDTVYEFVHRAVPIGNVSHVPLEPRGGTALLDAVGKAIAETGERLKGTAEADRPGLVVFVIVTDGEENSSHEYTKAQIKQMIQHQQDVYKWQFTFLGANQDAFAEAAAMGIPLTATANYAPASTRATFTSASSNLSRMRGASLRGQTVVNAYTEQERKDMADKP